MADFLFEIGLEEVPARMLAGGESELADRSRNLLLRERLLPAEATVESFSTPRRLAVLVRGLLPQQAESQEDLLGPPVKAAYKDGQPTAAAHAFAAKAGVEVSALRTVTNPKGEYLAATRILAGRSAADILCDHLPTEVAALYWAKSMVWRPGRPERPQPVVRFVRPVQWLLALLDDTIVPVEWAGHTAGRVTFGHRILHGSAPVTIGAPSGYRETLRAAFVLADVEERRHRIRKALDHVTRTEPGARWREDHPLVDKVTHLTEWPSVLMGSFEPDFLRLPEEVLVTVMRDHQNYFAPEDTSGDQAGKLLPRFLAVLNTEVAEHAGGIIRHGNERVLRARFNDARFFYDFDQRIPLTDRVPLLGNVTFQKDLGSYASKSERVRNLAARLAYLVSVTGIPVDASVLDRAALLAKTDLTTELVKEFTELQGIVGGLYAQAQGESEAVARAIYDQYLPASMEGSLPRTIEGLLLSIADKADTIRGMFSLGLQPTGSKDPFALRRAANGIIKMLAQASVMCDGYSVPLPLTITTVSFADTPVDEIEPMRRFLSERLDWYLREVAGGSYDVVNAVMATHPEDVPDAISRVKAVTAARATPDFAAISAAFKRMKNILEQARAKAEPMDHEPQGRPGSPEEEAHLQLEADRIAAEAARLAERRDYAAALQSIATLRPAIDSFFDKVMVMDPDPVVRAARLGLLSRILRDFSRIADFSEIVVTG